MCLCVCVLKGIASYSPGNKCGVGYSVYTEIAAYKEWIDSYVWAIKLIHQTMEHSNRTNITGCRPIEKFQM